MFSIETINKLDKRWRLLLMFIFGLVLIVGVAALCLYFKHVQDQQRFIALEKAVSSLRLQALKAQTDGDLDKADNLYTQALADAESSNSNMKSIEFLSRLVQVKIQNHKLGRTDALVQKAVKLALSIKDTNASDSNLDVWMNDMADAFYKHGEHTTRDDVKEYCLKHYLDIKLPLEDQFDNFLVARADTLILYLEHNGHEQEASPYELQVFYYLQRTKSNDPATMLRAHRHLVRAFTEQHQFASAELAIKQYYELRNKIDRSSGNDAELNLDLGHLREAAGDLRGAGALYQKVVDTDTGKPNVWFGIHKNMLGFVEQRLGNLTEAAKLYNASLDCFDHCHPTEVTCVNAFLHPEGGFYSGQVFADEHLAQIELQRGHAVLASLLQMRAKQIRAQNPHWNVKHPDPDSFYALVGFFPFQIEIIPTHFSLQEINPN